MNYVRKESYMASMNFYYKEYDEKELVTYTGISMNVIEPMGKDMGCFKELLQKN